jgi:hypothetical protein
MDKLVASAVKKIGTPVIAAFLGLIVLGGCGGGGTTSGTGGSVNASASTGPTSSIVIDLSGGELAMLDGEASQVRGASQIAAILADFLVESAWAQTEGFEIFVDGDLAGTTDPDGNLAFAVVPGMHEVCIENPDDDAKCVDVSVEEDEVVIITGFGIDPVTGELQYDAITTESAFDNIVLFEDPDKAHKTLVCHKGETTISVGTPAAQNGHMVHGDSLGECANFAANDGGNNPSPANSNDAPGGSGGSSGNDTPGNSGGAPGNSGNAPGNSGGSPGNSGNAPGNQGNA